MKKEIISIILIIGIAVVGGQIQRNSLTQLARSCGAVVDRSSSIYMGDCDNYRILQWLRGSAENRIVIGGNGSENNQISSIV